ncbi:DoxX family protein [Novosphingobium kaempferiae]|uniref:DoxX family protein n=1 Tax=Novosphingobium kaempferiae TaxID=2896849 RepID=UPI001E396487|nr:DoxX family protein [Novosphingobium kaempferiae]
MTTNAQTAPAVSNSLEAWLPVVGRVLIAAIFILSGISKITDPASAMAYISSVGLPLPAVALAAAIVVELVGGALLIVGYRVRTVAVVIALFSVATAVFFHNNLADQNQFIHFFKNIAIAGGLLQIVAFGKARG